MVFPKEIMKEFLGHIIIKKCEWKFFFYFAIKRMTLKPKNLIMHCKQRALKRLCQKGERTQTEITHGGNMERICCNKTNRTAIRVV